MTPTDLFTKPDTTPTIDYVAYRERNKERQSPDFFCKLSGCHNGLKAWATGTGATPEAAVADALQAWASEGK